MYQAVWTSLLTDMTCNECGHPIQGEAVRRSGHTWHLDCWCLRGIRLATLDAQRPIGGTLSQRLARA